jgi:acyl-CoA synthetase (AMP-forming)/AMP-acid ligase II
MTLSIATGETDLPLLHETISANLDATAARFPEHEALVDCATGKRWTYAAFAADVDTLARGFAGSGVVKGDRVGIWAPNGAEWTLVQYATAKVGAILVNINPAYRTHELQYVLNQAAIKVLVAAPSFKTSDYAGMIDEVRDEVATLEQVVLIGRESWVELWAAAEQVSQAELEAIAAGLSPDDPINIQYTSGTTGFPKGATLSHVNILNNGFLWARSAATPRPTGSAFPCPSITASAWSWATSRRPPTGRAWSSRRRASTRRSPSPRCVTSDARASMACRRCSSPNGRSSRPVPRATTWRPCAPGSWRARRARPS